MRRYLASFLMLLALGQSLPAHDKWESMFGGLTNDDGPGGNGSDTNVLVHGVSQTHDLEGSVAVPDQDWMLVPTTARHSYEARLINISAVASYGSCAGCMQVSRVNAAGTILTAQSNPLGSNGAVSVRWTAPTTIQSGEYIRVRGDNAFAASTVNDQYTIEFFDTTVFGARFNNNSTMVTVVLLQNLTRSVLTGNAHFYNAAGSLLHSENVNVPVQGLQLINTPTIAALIGQSGSLAITHSGGYGGLSGKAMSLEPATGFAFDTPLVSLPR